MRALLSILIAGAPVAAAPEAGAFSLLNASQGKDGLTLPIQILVLLSALSVLPAVFVTLTPFLRITVVLHFLRQALGTQTAPSNQVMIGLALFLTLLLIQPILKDCYDAGWVPLEQNKISRQEAWEAGSKPLRLFLLRYAKEKDVALMLSLTKSAPPRNPEDLTLSVLAPAYVLSELKVSFQIGAVLFLPFLIIDIVVASITLSIGMVQLPPVMVSAPFKILLFVLVDGWNLVVGSLMRSF